MNDHTLGATKTNGVPHGMTAFEHHLRQVAIRAVRLQDERDDRLAKQEGLRRRPLGMITGGGHVRSPFQDLVDEARAARRPKGEGWLARLFNW